MARKKTIATPGKLWKAFQDYEGFEKSEMNAVTVQEFVGRDGKEVNRRKTPPLTMEAFDLYLVNQGYDIDLDAIIENRDKQYTKYAKIITRINKAIRADQIRGGMTGIYNPTITTRLNGLTDRKQSENHTMHEGAEVTIVHRISGAELPTDKD